MACWLRCGVVVALGVVATQARAGTQAEDLANVLSLLHVASVDYDAETAKCKGKEPPPCAAHDDPVHEARVQAYKAVKVALTAYIVRWDNVPNWDTQPPATADMLKQMVRLALVSERAETPSDAAKYYQLCLRSPLIDQGITTAVTGTQQEDVKAVATTGLKEECHVAGQTCGTSGCARGGGGAGDAGSYYGGAGAVVAAADGCGGAVAGCGWGKSRRSKILYSLSPGAWTCRMRATARGPSK
jgi:hypothetical protein